MNNLRNRIIRLAQVKPELRPHLLPILAGGKVSSSGVRGPGGLIFDRDSRGFALRTIPSDPPYNQTYEGLILMDGGGKKPYQAALEVVQQFKDEIMRMKTPYEVIKFVDQHVYERVGKAPKWHHYYMPD